MNPIFAVALLAVTMVAGQDHGSGNCCAPQPITIQLSCNGNSQNPPPSPPPPFFPPPGGMGGGVGGPGGFDPHMCDFNADGYPVGHPPGGFPPGFRVYMDEQGMPKVVTDDPAQYPLPSQDWDGNPEHLGFPFPPPGTPHFNMLTCYPIPVITSTG